MSAERLDPAWAIYMAQAAANLLVARNALSEATVALRSVSGDNTAAWDLARQLEGLRKQVNAEWIAAHEMVWHPTRRSST